MDDDVPFLEVTSERVGVGLAGGLEFLLRSETTFERKDETKLEGADAEALIFCLPFIPTGLE